MAPLLLSVLLAACILILVDHAAGTKNMVLSAASFSSVYLIIFYSRRAIAAASSTDERRFSIRAAWCASLILVLISRVWGAAIRCAVHRGLCMGDYRKYPADGAHNSWGSASRGHRWSIALKCSGLIVDLFKQVYRLRYMWSYWISSASPAGIITQILV